VVDFCTGMGIVSIFVLLEKGRSRRCAGEQKTNMLRWHVYGAAARVSGECVDEGGAEALKASALDAESLYRPGQLPKPPGKTPLAGWSTTLATHDAGTRDAVESLVAVAQGVIVECRCSCNARQETGRGRTKTIDATASKSRAQTRNGRGARGAGQASSYLL
jgi:hypothetical protein